MFRGIINFFKRNDHSIVEKVFLQSIQATIANKFTRAAGVAVDGVVVGMFLGVESLAAYGLSWPLSMIYSLPGSTLSGGTRNLYSKYLGRGATDTAANVFTIGLLLSVGCSLGLAVLTFIFMEQLGMLLGANGENAGLLLLVCQYLLGLIIGLPFDNMAKYIAGFLGMDSNYKLVVTGMTVATVTNIAGDLIVVALLGGDMFMLGLTTSVSRMMYFATIATHFLRKERMLCFSLTGLTGVREKISTILANSTPALCDRVFSSLGAIASNCILSAASGGIYLAAYSVHKSLTSFIGSLYYGIGDTVWTLASVYHGEEDKKSLDELQKVTLKIGLGMAVGAAVLLWLFSRSIANIYMDTGDTKAFELTIEAVQMFALSVPLYLLFFSFVNYMTGIGSLKAANNFTFMANFGVIVPVVWVMVNAFGGRGAWLATPLIQLLVLAGAACYIYFHRTGDPHDVKRLLLPPDFDTTPGKELTIIADSMLEVMGMSRIVTLFCQENNIRREKAEALAHCIEELGGNIIEHGFNDGKPHAIDVRILAKENEIILRIRDDCRPFNPVNYYKTYGHDGNKEKNIGLRLVINMTKSIKYISTMGTNNLVIKI